MLSFLALTCGESECINCTSHRLPAANIAPMINSGLYSQVSGIWRHVLIIRTMLGNESQLDNACIIHVDSFPKVSEYDIFFPLAYVPS